MLKTLLIFSLLAPAAFGVAFECSEFASLAEDADPVPLIRQTYARLVREFSTRVTPETFRKIAAGNDPFAVSEGGEANAAMAKRFREFKKMLSQQEWATRETRQLLLEDLKATLAADDVSRAQRDDALRKTASDHVMPFPTRTAIAVSADGKYVVGLAINEKDATEYHVYDPETRQVTTHKCPPLDFNRAIFTADSRHLAVSGPDGRVGFVPFAGGKADFSNVTWVGGNASETGLPRLKLTAAHNPRRIWGFDNKGGSELYSYDLDSKQRTRVDLSTQLIPVSEIREHGLVPGSDDLWMVTAEKNRSAFQRLRVDADGKVTQVGEKIGWKDTTYNARFMPNGTTLVTADHDSILTLEAGDKKAQVLFERRVLNMPGSKIVDIIPHPGGRYLAVQIQVGQNAYRLEWIDLQKRERTGTVPLPDFGQKPVPFRPSIQFSPNGDFLYVRDQHSKTHVLNYEPRMQPPK